MFKKKGEVLLLTAGFILVPISELSKQQNNSLHEFHHHVEKKQKTTYEPNVTSYESTDGTHNIYWAQGITPPTMTLDPELLGKPGYFAKEYVDSPSGGMITYSAEFAPGNGYYDYNKNLDSRYHEHPLCYLGASANILKWWIDQNREFIDEYVRRLKETDIYSQLPGLYPVNNFDQSLWDKMFMDPGEEIVEGGYIATAIGKSPFTTDILKPYYNKKDKGYWPDMVFDFFMNGYDAIPNTDFAPINTPENFFKDPRGGFFFPIFGKEKISTRLEGDKYAKYWWYNENLKDIINNGYGVVFSYLTPDANKGHSVTVWGAEYDSNGDLDKLYITDSDDFQPSQAGDKRYRGLSTFDVHEDPTGTLCVGNSINPDPDRPGARISHTAVLPLAQDKFKAALDDTAEPTKPTILKEPESRVYAKGAVTQFEVQATNSDNGTLFYDWYVSDSPTEKGKRIHDGTHPIAQVTLDTIGTKYYYCDVQNVKNGKVNSVETKHFKVEVQDIPLINAEVPNIRFNSDTKEIFQYDSPGTLFKVNASVKSGTLSYQWYKSTSLSYSTDGIKLEGETNPVFYPPTDKPGDYYYFCEVTNIDPSVNGNMKAVKRTSTSKRLKIKPAELTDAKIPTIIKSPNNINVEVNTPNQELKVEAKVFDGGNLSYQWYLVNPDYSETKLVNETSNIYKVDTSIPGSRMYKCVITNTNLNASNSTTNVTDTGIVYVDITGDAPLSGNNNLLALNLTNATISPNFSSENVLYTANLEHKSDKLELETTIDPTARIEINNPTIGFGETKDVTIKVIAQNGNIKTYTITVTRNSEHKFGEWQIVNEPTCTEEGLAKRTCSECGFEETKVLEKLEHKIATRKENVVEASCGKPGSYELVTYCEVCGEVIKRETITTPALEHEWGAWEVVKEPTYDEEGLERRVCNICNEVEERSIPKLEKPITPDPEKPEIPENPDVDNPDVENPDIEKPEVPETTEPVNNNVGAIIAGVTVPIALIVTIGLIIFIIKKKQ